MAFVSCSLERVSNIVRRQAQQPFKPLRGYSLLELMLVLVLIAVLLVFSVLYYKSTQQDRQVGEAFNMMNAMYDAYEKYLKANGEFGSVTLSPSLQTLQTDGFLNIQYLQNPWGKAPSLVGAATNSGIELTVKSGGMPETACKKLASRANSTPTIGYIGGKYQAACTASGDNSYVTMQYLVQ